MDDDHPRWLGTNMMMMMMMKMKMMKMMMMMMMMMTTMIEMLSCLFPLLSFSLDCVFVNETNDIVDLANCDGATERRSDGRT